MIIIILPLVISSAMGRDDFDKFSNEQNTIRRGSFLGIRETISKRLDFEVNKLSEKMGIMEKIIQALDDGNQSLNIPFPSNLVPTAKVNGEYNWSHVADRLVASLRSEGFSARYTTEMTQGGCSHSPILDYARRGCITCRHSAPYVTWVTYKEHYVPTLSLLVLENIN